MTLILEIEPDVAQLDEELRDLLDRDLTTASGLASGFAPATVPEAAPASAPASAPAPVVSLADARMRRAVVGAARELLAVADYSAVDFEAVAQVAGLRAADVRRHFGCRMELTLAALRLPPALSGARRARLSGGQTVARFLAFWEAGDNAPIMLNILRAATRDRRVIREVEGLITERLLEPLAGSLGTPDACPRVRLVTSALMGLAVSRYVLCEEPLASADHATVAAWMGPALDCYLCGTLGM